MKIVIDNHIVKSLVINNDLILRNPSLFNRDMHIIFRWPSLLEYLEQGTLFSNLPTFDQNHPLFQACISTLCSKEDRETVFHVYDSLFTEILNQISALPQINTSFLLQAIKEQRQKNSHLEVNTLLFPILATYETSLMEKGSDVRHDLILYLAWDRMCVWMARLFDYQSSNSQFIKGIGILKTCLIESYQHILQQGRTFPGIYRMLESFLFYQMREENLEKLNAHQWTVVSQSFQVLKAQEELVDFFYIDDAVVGDKELGKENSETYVTFDSPARIQTRLALVHYMMDQLKSEVPSWNYHLRQKNIVSLE